MGRRGGATFSVFSFSGQPPQRPAVSAWRPPGKKKRRSRRRPRPKSCGTIADGRAHNVKGVAEWARPLAVNKAGTRKKPAPSAKATRRRGQSLGDASPPRRGPLDSRGSRATQLAANEDAGFSTVSTPGRSGDTRVLPSTEGIADRARVLAELVFNLCPALARAGS